MIERKENRYKENRILKFTKKHSLTIINILIFFFLFTSGWLLVSACLLGLLQVLPLWSSHDPSHYKSTYVMLITLYAGLLLVWLFRFIAENL